MDHRRTDLHPDGTVRWKPHFLSSDWSVQFHCGGASLGDQNVIEPKFLPLGWHWLVMEWMILALIVAGLLAIYRRMLPKKVESDDINSY